MYVNGSLLEHKRKFKSKKGKSKHKKGKLFSTCFFSACFRSCVNRVHRTQVVLHQTSRWPLEAGFICRHVRHKHNRKAYAMSVGTAPATNMSTNHTLMLPLLLYYTKSRISRNLSIKITKKEIDLI